MKRDWVGTGRNDPHVEALWGRRRGAADRLAERARVSAWSRRLVQALTMVCVCLHRMFQTLFETKLAEAPAVGYIPCTSLELLATVMPFCVRPAAPLCPSTVR